MKSNGLQSISVIPNTRRHLLKTDFRGRQGVQFAVVLGFQGVGIELAAVGGRLDQCASARAAMLEPALRLRTPRRCNSSGEARPSRAQGLVVAREAMAGNIRVDHAGGKQPIAGAGRTCGALAAVLQDVAQQGSSGRRRCLYLMNSLTPV